LPLAGPEVTEENLISRFSHYGSIEKMVIQRGADSQSAFILFYSEEAASTVSIRIKKGSLCASIGPFFTSGFLRSPRYDV